MCSCSVFWQSCESRNTVRVLSMISLCSGSLSAAITMAAGALPASDEYRWLRRASKASGLLCMAVPMSKAAAERTSLDAADPGLIAETRV